jgi:hypothetical protein
MESNNMENPNRAVEKSKAKGGGPQAIHRGAHLSVYREVKVVMVAETRPPADFKSNKLDSAEKVDSLWRSAVARSAWYQEDKEHFVCICLDTRHRMKSFSLISIGSLNESIAHPREIFRPAIAVAAHSIIIAHNHPSGDPSPSDSDIALTRRIHETGDLLQISLLDHVIVGDQKYFSIRQEKDEWPPRSPWECSEAAPDLEELRAEEQALHVIRSGPALAARKMDLDSLAGGIKEQLDALEKDPAYTHGLHAEVIAALALELSCRSRKNGGKQ